MAGLGGLCHFAPMDPPPPHRILMVAFDNAQVLDVTGPLEVFARTSRWLTDHRKAPGPAYEIAVAAECAGPLVTSGGLRLHADCAFADVVEIDTLLIAGGVGYRELLAVPGFVDWLKTAAGTARRVASICTGSLILAEAGLLDRRRATTHWAYVDELRRRAPLASVEPDAIFVRDGQVLTSAGVTAGMDLALALVEEDWGRSTALSVAQELVLFLKRPGLPHWPVCRCGSG